MQMGFVARLWDRVSLLWSFVIVITNLARLYVLKSSDQESSIETQQSTYKTIRNIAILNYTALIKDFKLVYCVLTLIHALILLIWRTYVIFYRPLRCDIETRNIPARDLIRFFQNGPEEHRPSQSELEFRIIGLAQKATRARSSWDHAINITQTINLIGNSPLTRLHRRPSDDELNFQDDSTPTGPQWFRNPIKGVNLETDHSYKRWNWLFMHTFIMGTCVSALGIPVTIFAAMLLNSHALSLIQSQSLQGDENLINRMLVYYGLAEITYIFSQAFLILSSTNIFITLFYADLMYRCQSIKADLLIHLAYLEKNQLYNTHSSYTIGAGGHSHIVKRNIHAQQLRLWSYFNYIDQLDSFISKYSIVSRAIFIVGISFGQGFLRTTDPVLKGGTASVLIGNFLSFTHVHIISWRIESQVSNWFSLVQFSSCWIMLFDIEQHRIELQSLILTKSQL